MSLGTIILIILVIALLGGFSGIGGSFLRHGLLRRWRSWSRNRHSADFALAWQTLIKQRSRESILPVALPTGARVFSYSSPFDRGIRRPR